VLICSFRKKISSVNSQLSKERNFEILFRNLEHVLFSKISQKKFHLCCAQTGQSASIHKHQMKRWLHRRCWLSKVYFQCESAYFLKKNFEIFISKLISNVKGALHNQPCVTIVWTEHNVLHTVYFMLVKKTMLLATVTSPNADQCLPHNIMLVQYIQSWSPRAHVLGLEAFHGEYGMFLALGFKSLAWPPSHFWTYNSRLACIHKYNWYNMYCGKSCVSFAIYLLIDCTCY